MEQEASQLMRGLSSSVDSEATIESLKGLMALIERADGATAEELAAALRRHGAVQRLCALVDDAAPSVHRRSMAILGNLVERQFEINLGSDESHPRSRLQTSKTNTERTVASGATRDG